jgi:hypothetical protein
MISSAAKETAAMNQHPQSAAPMTRRDYAWHRMDADNNIMVINSILLFEGPVDMERSSTSKPTSSWKRWSRTSAGKRCKAT